MAPALPAVPNVPVNVPVLPALPMVPPPEGGPVVAEVTPKKPLSEDEVKAATAQRQGLLINPGNSPKGGNEKADQFREAVGGPREPGFGATVNPTGSGEGTDPVAGEKGGNEGFTGLE